MTALVVRFDDPVGGGGNRFVTGIWRKWLSRRRRTIPRNQFYYKSNKAAGSIGLPNISFHCDFWSSVSLARRSASRSSRILITLP